MENLTDVEFLVDLGFAPDAKAVEDDIRAKFADQLDDGDVLIHGWGANFEVDRQDEAFTEGAFERGLKTFVENGGALCHHHRHADVIGKVLDAELVPGKGVRITARVDKQPESSPLRGVYEQVKKGTLRSLSAGGFFRRTMTPAGPRISDVDLVEWSVTGTPVGKGNVSFAVIAGKALEDLQAPEEPDTKSVEDAERLAWLENYASKLGEVFETLTPAENVSD